MNISDDWLSAAWGGCEKSAIHLIVSTPPPLRGQLAWSFFEKPAPLRVRRAVLSTGWESSGWGTLQEIAEYEIGDHGISLLFQWARFPPRQRTPPGVDTKGFYIYSGKVLDHQDHLNDFWLSTSWTIDRKIAVHFMHMRPGHVGALIKTRVRLRDVAYYSNDRQEHEVILNKNPREFSVRFFDRG